MKKKKKRTPRHQSPSSFQYNHISKLQKGKTQRNPIPNKTNTLENSEPTRTQVKISMLDAARTDFQKSFPPTKRNKANQRIEFPNGVYIYR